MSEGVVELAKDAALGLIDSAIASYLGAALIVLRNGDFGMAADMLDKASKCCQIRKELGEGSECASALWSEILSDSA